MIAALLNQKGGVGKTTLSIHIASALASQGSKVLLLDADTQRSVLDWFNAREKEPLFSVMGLPSNQLHKQVKILMQDYEHIIIDGPPRVYDVAKSCIVASDIVLIPIQPSPYDVWSAEEIIRLLQEVREPLSGYKEIASAFVINRKIPNSVIARDVQTALQAFQIPILSPQITQRVIYAETAANGTSAIEESPQSAAAQDIIQLSNNILTLLEQKKAA